MASATAQPSVLGPRFVCALSRVVTLRLTSTGDCVGGVCVGVTCVLGDVRGGGCMACGARGETSGWVSGIAGCGVCSECGDAHLRHR